MDDTAPAHEVAAAAGNERAPLGSWRRVYALVLAWLAVQIGLYSLLSRVGS
jgi:hypothetical protein